MVASDFELYGNICSTNSKTDGTTDSRTNSKTYGKIDGKFDGKFDGKIDGKRRNRNTAITVTYLNEMPPGALEKALADIYAAKVKNGTLNLREL